MSASTRAEVRCVRKLDIVNGFGYRSYRLFHDLLYWYYYCERSELQPLFLILERGAKPVFCSPSISEALLPGQIGFMETIFKEVHLRPARTRLSPFLYLLSSPLGFWGGWLNSSRALKRIVGRACLRIMNGCIFGIRRDGVAHPSYG